MQHDSKHGEFNEDAQLKHAGLGRYHGDLRMLGAPFMAKCDSIASCSSPTQPLQKLLAPAHPPSLSIVCSRAPSKQQANQ